MPEIWKPIPGYENQYEVSDHGRVRSTDHATTVTGRHGKPFSRRIKGRVLRPGAFTKTGHLCVNLRPGNRTRPVHQLVLLAFTGPPPEGHVVCHTNGDPTDNRLENLRYDTQRGNMADFCREGAALRKLTVDDITSIRDELAAGTSGSELAERYNVGNSTISRIKNRTGYAWAR